MWRVVVLLLIIVSVFALAGVSGSDNTGHVGSYEVEFPKNETETVVETPTEQNDDDIVTRFCSYDPIVIPPRNPPNDCVVIYENGTSRHVDNAFNMS